MFFIQEKSEVSGLIDKFIKCAKTDGIAVKIIRSDNGKEFVNKQVKSYLECHSVRHHTTVPYAPEQNGCAEREMRTIVEAARSMIHSKCLDYKFWAKAVNCAVYILNRTGPCPVAGKSPYELWFNRASDVNNLRVFGSNVFMHIPK